MAKVKVRTIHREELPGIAILRDAVAADLAAYPSSRGTLDLEMDTDPELRHLLSHDPDGFFTVYEGGETLGFAAAHVVLTNAHTTQGVGYTLDRCPDG